ncbi:hypothetical protein B9Z55_006349 [Caenorhabditis nigoni]|uniref:Insulin-like domain-containing protein n=1 Tax=Caenorhabditis nigoni TaxID=1611254 RepID=A0A2G5V4T3_9PELO|nr:hypothetical protein B9Z55_006349 [Caenorhabditis nigoni]
MKLLSIFLLFLLCFSFATSKVCKKPKPHRKMCGMSVLRHLKSVCRNGFTRDYGKLLVLCCDKGCSYDNFLTICDKI